jgi:ACS family hexuronate transporter-like MFS transporter
MAVPVFRRLRWWIVALVMAGTILNFLTRNSLAVAAPTLKAELGIDEWHYAWITGAFQAGIMLQPAAGYILDTIGLRAGMALFAAAWGLLAMAHGLAGGWRGLFALRGLLGFAEGANHPGGMKTVALWFPAKERGLAAGTYNIGASLGAMLAPPLVAGAILIWSWRGAFLVCGALALLWALAWLLFYEAPARHRRLSGAERAEIEAGQEAHLEEGERPSIPGLLARRNLWGIALPRFLADPAWGTLTFWMPLYLSEARGFDLRHIALFAWMPFVAADAGCLFGPAVSLWLQRRGVGLIDARRFAFTLGALLMTGVMFAGWVASPYAAIALFCLAAFAHQTLSISVITMASDLFRRSEVATVAGLAGTMANFGVLLFSLAIGGLVARIGYEPFFIALGLLDLLAAAALWTIVRVPEPA